jgi:ABC-type multidrug transport system ATPase subunit
MRLAAEHADRVIVFSGGQAVLDGSPEEVFYQKDILKKASVTPPDCASIGYCLRDYGFTGSPVTTSELANQLLVTLNGGNNAD